MVNRLLSTIILLITVNFTYSQINVKIEQDCMDNNSAIMAQTLINLLGEDTISKYLDNNTIILFGMYVDSLGSVKKIEKLYTKKEVPLYLNYIAEKYLINKRVRFYICYERLPDTGYEKSYRLIMNELKGENEHLINVSFPGNYMVLFEIDRRNAEKKHQILTKLDYLKAKIKIYHPNKGE